MNTIPRDQWNALRSRCTPRQVEIVTLIANGNSFKQAACELGVSVKTIRRQIFRARARMDARTKEELVAKLVKLNVVQVNFDHVDSPI